MRFENYCSVPRTGNSFAQNVGNFVSHPGKIKIDFDKQVFFRVIAIAIIPQLDLIVYQSVFLFQFSFSSCLIGAFTVAVLMILISKAPFLQNYKIIFQFLLHVIHCYAKVVVFYPYIRVWVMNKASHWGLSFFAITIEYHSRSNKCPNFCIVTEHLRIDPHHFEE